MCKTVVVEAAFSGVGPFRLEVLGHCWTYVWGPGRRLFGFV